MPTPKRPFSRWVMPGPALAIGIALALQAAPALAQPLALDDPYHYDLRVGLFPVAFQGGISQSHFGSAARAELDLARHLGAEVSGMVPWVKVAGEPSDQTFTLRAGVLLHFIDRIETTPLSGTVYPEDAPIAGSRGPGADHDLEVPTATKLGGPRLAPPDQDRTTSAPVRRLHTLRLGYDLARAVERARPDASDGSKRYLLNTLHALYLGYAWGSQWNLGPAATGGKREVGWRRFYIDAVLTLPALASAKPTASTVGEPPAFFPVGARIGMQGAIDALLRDAPGIGFGYSLELGALPGRSGVEGYLLVGLGLSLDLPVRSRSLRR
jgi:hypothetical protein